MRFPPTRWPQRASANPYGGQQWCGWTDEARGGWTKPGPADISLLVESLLLVAMPGATSSVLAPRSNARRY